MYSWEMKGCSRDEDEFLSSEDYFWEIPRAIPVIVIPIVFACGVSGAIEGGIGFSVVYEIVV